MIYVIVSPSTTHLGYHNLTQWHPSMLHQQSCFALSQCNDQWNSSCPWWLLKWFLSIFMVYNLTLCISWVINVILFLFEYPTPRLIQHFWCVKFFCMMSHAFWDVFQQCGSSRWNEDLITHLHEWTRMHWCSLFSKNKLSLQREPLIPRFAVTIFTYRKNGGKLPVTKGKPGNYGLPTGKKSVYQQRFFMVKLNFQWWHLDAKVTHSGNFENYWKNYCPKKLPFTVFNPVNYW